MTEQTDIKPGFEVQYPIDSIPTDPEELLKAFQTFERKYHDLVWYARSRPRHMMEADGTPEHIIQGALNGQARKEEMYPDEIDSLNCPDCGSFWHGFNSGCLAAMRFVLMAMSKEVFPDEESEDPNATYTVGGIEDAKEEFPFLDT